MSDIYVFSSDDENNDYSTMGLVGALEPTECTFEETANGDSIITMVHPLDEFGKYTALQRDNILVVPVPVRTTPEIQNGSCVTQVWQYKVKPLNQLTSKNQRTLYKKSSGSGRKKIMNAGDVVTVVTKPRESQNISRWKVKSKYGTGWIDPNGFDLIEEKTLANKADAIEEIQSPWSVTDQLFRIQEVEKELTSVTVTARHISYDLLYDATYWYYGTENSTTLQNCIDRILADSYSRPTDTSVEGSPFRAYTNVANTQAGFSYRGKNPIECFLDPEEGVCAKFGVDLIRDNHDLYFLASPGINRGVRIQYGKNLTGITYKDNTDEVVTRIIPTGEMKNGEELFLAPSVKDQCIDSPKINDYPVIHVYYMKCENCKIGDKDENGGTITMAIARNRMRAQAQKLFESGIDEPKIEMSVEFVNLGDTEEYSQFKDLENCFLFDYVLVQSPNISVDVTAQIVKIEWDCILDRMNSVEIGAVGKTLGNAGITSWQIPSGFSGGKIANGTVGSGSLKENIIAAKHIQSDTINADHIQANAVTADKIAANSITASKIAAGAVEADKIKAGAVTADKIDAKAVTAEKIDANAIDTDKIKAGAVTTAKLAAGAVTADKIDAKAVTAEKIDANAIDADKIKAGAVTTAKLAAGSVTAEKIASKTITADLIAAKTITADSGIIDDSAIGTAQIADGSITSAKIVSLNADVINAGTLSAERLVLVGDDGVIYKINVASSGLSLTELSKDQYKNYINGTVIVAKSITAAQIAAQTITGNEILAGSITAKEIDVSDLFASQATINALNAMDIRGNKYLQLYVTDAVDKVEVGGRNLLIGTNQGTDGWGVSLDGGTGATTEMTHLGERGVKFSVTGNAGRWAYVRYGMNGRVNLDALESDTDYMLSFDALSNKTTSVSVLITQLDSRGSLTSPVSCALEKDVWKRYTVALHTISGELPVNDQVVFFNLKAGNLHIAGSELSIVNIKLEKGTKATDWTPAPEDAQKDIDVLETRMTTAESQILQKADSITLGVLQTQVDNMSIGGTNILRGTNAITLASAAPAEWSAGKWRTQQSTREVISISNAPNANISKGLRLSVSDTTLQNLAVQDNIPLTSGESYTVSAYVRCTQGTVKFFITLTGLESQGLSVNLTAAANSAWKRYSVTLQNNAASKNCYIGCNSGSNGAIEICGMKLEKGNMSTDWSPAPEDAQSDITSLKSRVTTAESQILQKADSITLSTLQTTVNNISIGGTNLLLGTGQSVTTPAGNSGTNQTTYCYYTTTNGRPQAKEPIVFSCDIQASSGATGTFYLQYTDNNSNYGAISSGANIADYTTKKHVVYAITNPWIAFAYMFIRRDNATGTLTISNAKLERGNKATDWSPAPEDPAGSLSVSSDYSKVDINTQRVRIVSKQMEVAVPSDDGEDDVMRVDADGVHAEVVEADQVVSDSVVSTQSAITYTPANGGALAAFLDELNGKHLTGRVYIDCKNVTSGNYTVEKLSGEGMVTLTNGTMNQLKIDSCGSTTVYVLKVNFSNSGTALLLENSLAVFISGCVINASTGIVMGDGWPTRAVMLNCSGDCSVMARVNWTSELRIVGHGKPTGTLHLANGSEVYNATPDPTFAAASSPSIPTTQTVTVSLSPTNTYTLRGTSNSDGNKLYQGRYSSSQGMRKGVMLFTLPSDLTSASNIDSAVLTLRRISGAGQGGGVTTQVRCFDQTGTVYGSATAYGGQTVSIDVTSGVKAMKTNGYTGLMLYNPDTTLVSGKSYTKSYARFAGKGESGAPVLKISYRK